MHHLLPRRSSRFARQPPANASGSPHLRGADGTARSTIRVLKLVSVHLIGVAPAGTQAGVGRPFAPALRFAGQNAPAARSCNSAIGTRSPPNPTACGPSSWRSRISTGPRCPHRRIRSADAPAHRPSSRARYQPPPLVFRAERNQRGCTAQSVRLAWLCANRGDLPNLPTRAARRAFPCRLRRPGIYIWSDEHDGTDVGLVRSALPRDCASSPLDALSRAPGASRERAPRRHARRTVPVYKPSSMSALRWSDPRAFRSLARVLRGARRSHRRERDAGLAGLSSDLPPPQHTPHRPKRHSLMIQLRTEPRHPLSVSSRERPSTGRVAQRGIVNPVFRATRASWGASRPPPTTEALVRLSRRFASFRPGPARRIEDEANGRVLASVFSCWLHAEMFPSVPRVSGVIRKGGRSRNTWRAERLRAFREPPTGPA